MGGDYVNRFTSGFKALSDLTRIRMLRMILTAGEQVCVCELADALELPQYQVSKHLAILRQVGLVTDSRIGTWVYYSVPPEVSEFALGIYKVVREHVTGPVFDSDAERLKARLELREEGRCVLGPNRSAAATRDVKGVQRRRTSREQ
jgi:DNA-binding transcriptional ArsR family regulator